MKSQLLIRILAPKVNSKNDFLAKIVTFQRYQLKQCINTCVIRLILRISLTFSRKNVFTIAKRLDFGSTNLQYMSQPAYLRHVSADQSDAYIRVILYIKGSNRSQMGIKGSEGV